MSNLNMEKWRKRFLILWSGQAVSLLTSSALQLALIWYITEETNSGMYLALASFCGFVPQAIFGAPIGVLVDRMNKKMAIIFADVFIALCGLIMLIFGLFNSLPIWLILIILAIRSFGSAVHFPAINSVTPLIVPKEDLVKASGYTQTINSMSYLLGPVIAGLVYGTFGLNAAILVDVVGALIASAIVYFITIPNTKNDIEKEDNMITQLKNGLSLIKNDKVLVTLLTIGIVFMLLFMPLGSLFPLMVFDYFDQSVFGATIVEVAFALGMLLGGLILSSWRGFKSKAHMLMLAFILVGTSCFFGGLLAPELFYLFALLTLLAGLGVPFYSGVEVAIYQMRVEQQFLGRVFGLIGSIMSITMPIGLLVGGFVVDIIGIQNWFVLSGAVCFILAVVVLVNPNLKNIENKITEEEN